MAKKSMVQRENKREYLINKYAQKRKQYKEIIRDPKSTDEEKWEAQVKLQALPANSCPTRRQRRCQLTGRPHGVYRKFGLSRNMLRKYAMSGFVPGLRKGSW